MKKGKVQTLDYQGDKLAVYNGSMVVKIIDMTKEVETVKVIGLDEIKALKNFLVEVVEEMEGKKNEEI